LWIQQSADPPPMAFEKLLESLLPTGPLREAIDRLLEVKRRSAEVADGPRIPEISDFLEKTLMELEAASPKLATAAGHPDELDVFLRRVLSAQ